MREIKFRGWDKNVKSMFSWEQILLRWNSFSIFVCPYFIVMQYTGLKDKNNKEIYEGDICIINNVNIDEEERYFLVEWDDDNARFILNGTSYVYDFDDVYQYEVEVIGDIFRNQDLLKESE